MTFDPYQQWLQIPPGRRPPGYFALLRLSGDETDTARIRAAFAARYEHVRKYRFGPQGPQTTALLDEISQAVNCLSDPQRRQQYAAEQLAAAVDYWLHSDAPPNDVYELLEELSFAPNHVHLSTQVVAARRLLATQPRTGKVAARAARLREILKAAELAMAGPRSYCEYHRGLVARLRSEYGRRPGGASKWRPELVRRWLEEENWIHPTVMETLTAAICAGDDQQSDRLLEAMYTRPPDGVAAAVPADPTDNALPLASVAAIDKSPVPALPTIMPPPPAPGTSSALAATLLRPARWPARRWSPLDLAVSAAVLLGVLLAAGALLARWLPGNESPPDGEQTVAQDDRPAPATGTTDPAAAAAPANDTPGKTTGTAEPLAAPGESPPSETATNVAVPPPALAATEQWGTLDRLVVWKGELHLLLSLDEAAARATDRPGASSTGAAVRPATAGPTATRVEAYTSKIGFGYQMTDYASLAECGQGDMVRLRGTARDRAAVQFRLDAAVPLVEIREVVRRDRANGMLDMNSRVAVDGPPREQIVRNLEINDCSQLLRFRPVIGAEVSVTGWVTGSDVVDRTLTLSPTETAAQQRVVARFAATNDPTLAYAVGQRIAIRGRVAQSDPNTLLVDAVRHEKASPPAAAETVAGTPLPAPPPSPEMTQPKTPVIWQVAGHRGEVTAVAIAPDGKTFASADQRGTIKIWQAGRDAPLRTIEAHNGQIAALAWAVHNRSDDELLLASGGADRMLRVWNTQAAAEDQLRVREIRTTAGISTIAWRNESVRFAAGLLSGELLVYDARSRGGAVARTQLGDKPMTALAWNPVHRGLLAVGDKRGTVWIIDMTQNVPLPVFCRTPDRNATLAELMAANPRLARMSAMQNLVVYEQPGGPCRGLAWSPQGGRLAIVETTLELWDNMQGGGRPTESKHPSAAAVFGTQVKGGLFWLKNDQYLLSADRKGLNGWRLATDAPVRQWPTDLELSAVDVEAAQVLVGFTDGTVALWRNPLFAAPGEDLLQPAEPAIETR